MADQDDVMTRKSPLLSSSSCDGRQQMTPRGGGGRGGYEPWGWPTTISTTSTTTDDSSSHNNIHNHDTHPNLFDDVHEMLLASILIYALADLRSLARQPGLLDEHAAQTLLYEFPLATKELVSLVTRHRSTILQHVPSRYTDLYFSALDSIQETTLRWSVCSETGETTNVSSDVVVCDDEHCQYELVYGIWMDSARKRITVTFRGSSTTKDWTMAANPFMTSIPNPVRCDELEEEIDIHYGFYAYLNEPSEFTSKTKFETILQTILQLLQQHSGYRIYVTGHSLGAALSTLFAFQAAASNQIPTTSPITCIHFASPMVGNLAFRNAFGYLEQQGQLQCLRVVNSMDMFTKLPDRASSSYLFPVCLPLGPVQYLGVSCLFFVCCQRRIFRHVGMGLKLYRHGRYKITFPEEPTNHKSLLWLAVKDWKKHLFFPIKLATTLPFSCCGSCVDCECCCRLEDFGINHQAVAYMDRLLPLQHDLKDKYLNDLYDFHASRNEYTQL